MQAQAPDWPGPVNKNWGVSAVKYKLGARAVKYKLRARAGKHKLEARAGKYKLWASARGQVEGRGLGNTNTL